MACSSILEQIFIGLLLNIYLILIENFETFYFFTPVNCSEIQIVCCIPPSSIFL